MPTGDQVTVPTQDRVRPHQQPHTQQCLLREVMQQCRQERPIPRREVDSLPVQMPLQHGDLMAQSQDLYILVPGAHRQQSQHREHVGHAQAGEFQQYERPSCRGDRHLRQSTVSA
jgi:hypothetical protein